MNITRLLRLFRYKNRLNLMDLILNYKVDIYTEITKYRVLFTECSQIYKDILDRRNKLFETANIINNNLEIYEKLSAKNQQLRAVLNQGVIYENHEIMKKTNESYNEILFSINKAIILNKNIYSKQNRDIKFLTLKYAGKYVELRTLHILLKVFRISNSILNSNVEIDVIKPNNEHLYIEVGNITKSYMNEQKFWSLNTKKRTKVQFIETLGTLQRAKDKRKRCPY